MSKNILVISTSLRSNSNSDILADYFMKGAKSAGNNVEKISLKDKNIAFCKGCLACLRTKKCVINDDAVEIADKMCSADVIVFATPIYYYEMSGQMKTLLDRANSLYTRDYSFRDIYMLTTAAEDEDYVPEKAVSGLNGWIDCFEKARLAGTVFAGGVSDAGDITNHPMLQKAYDMGTEV